MPLICRILRFLLTMRIITTMAEENFPLAPINVEMHCLTGMSRQTSPIFVRLCPLATTSCGMLEIWRNNKVVGSVYECLDSSIFVSESEDEEAQKKYTYSKICNDQPKCRRLPADLFNRDFLGYLNRTYTGLLAKPIQSIRLCCAFDRGKLQDVVRDPSIGLLRGSDRLKKPIRCNNVLCMPNAVGCIHYEQKTMVNDSEFEETFEYSEEESPLIPFEDNDGYGCVYRHLNDEIFRYCLLIKRKYRHSGCFDGGNHRICCCFTDAEESTCDPLHIRNKAAMTVSTTTQISNNVQINRLSHDNTSTIFVTKPYLPNNHTAAGSPCIQVLNFLMFIGLYMIFSLF